LTSLRVQFLHRPLRMAVVVAVAYWILESGMHAYVWDNGSLFDTLLGEHDPNELWMRFIITALLLGFGAHMQRVMGRESRMRIRVERLNRLLNFLSDINQHVQHQRKEQSLFDAACRAAVQGGFRFAWIGKANDDGISLSAWAADSGSRIKDDLEHLNWSHDLSHCLCVMDALDSGQHRLCDLREQTGCNAPWRDLFIAWDCCFSVALPIRLDKRTIGVFEIYTGQDENFNKEELAILNEAVDDISFVLMDIRHERQRKADEDALKQRLEELERFQKATVQREFRIKELRNEIGCLKAEIASAVPHTRTG